MADHIFILDHSLNPQIEEQAIGRCHRVGQLKPVTVIKYVMENSIEQKLCDQYNALEKIAARDDPAGAANDVGLLEKRGFTLQQLLELVYED